MIGQKATCSSSSARWTLDELQRTSNSGRARCVAIAGAGNVGLFIANDLVSAGHQVQLIEQNPTVVDRSHSADGVEWLLADACEVASLRQAGLERCDVVVAATGDDEDNLVISLLAKQEFGVPRVVARVNHPKRVAVQRELGRRPVGVDTSPSPRSSRKRFRWAGSCASCSSNGARCGWSK